MQRTAIAEYAQQERAARGQAAGRQRARADSRFPGRRRQLRPNAVQRRAAPARLERGLGAQRHRRRPVCQADGDPDELWHRVPLGVAAQYATILKERRKGAVGVLPSAAYAPKGDPSDDQLQGVLQRPPRCLPRPERRVIRYASFGEEALRQRAAADRCADRRALQARTTPSTRRSRDPHLHPAGRADRSGGKRHRGARSQSGKSLAAAARQQGPGHDHRRAGDARRTSPPRLRPAVANAAFAAAQGALVPAARGGLGWYVLKVDKIENTPGAEPRAGPRARSARPWPPNSASARSPISPPASRTSSTTEGPGSKRSRRS